MKRILSLLAAAAVVAATLFVVVPLAGARPAAATVNVTAKEYSFKLSTKSARHGTVIFKVVNKGKFEHDFKIAGKKTKMLKKNQSATLTVKLAKGKHKYVCTVPGH